ncbi:hypothetical protein OAM67_00320 [bacterium]|nr:hypothetical protein [bacterium]
MGFVISTLRQQLHTPHKPRITYYYQTLTSLKPLLAAVDNDHTLAPRLHVFLSSIHFGSDARQQPYIHLNDLRPNDPKFTVVWQELKQLCDTGATVGLMVGGAGGAFSTLFSNFAVFYPMLRKLLASKPWIRELDMDVEEQVPLNSIRMLIHNLRADFPSLVLTMAPVASALTSNNPGLGGFCYKQLVSTAEGAAVNRFHGQFYGCFNADTFQQAVRNGWSPSQIVIGCMMNQDFEQTLQELKKIQTVYPSFAGVFVWEYFQAPPDTSNPAQWAVQLVKHI